MYITHTCTHLYSDLRWTVSEKPPSESVNTKPDISSDDILINTHNKYTKVMSLIHFSIFFSTDSNTLIVDRLVSSTISSSNLSSSHLKEEYNITIQWNLSIVDTTGTHVTVPVHR